MRRTGGETAFQALDILAMLLLMASCLYPFLYVTFASVSLPERIVVHRAKDHTDADQWDLEFWQNQTPEMRLLALVELRNDLGKVRGRNRIFDE